VATAGGAAGYGLDNAWRDALARLRSLEDWLDPGTIRHLRARGAGAGWRCLEVGAGAGSVARWLSAAVGSGGDVLAIRACQDPRFAFMSQVTMAAWGRRP
jgi:ubiquinone/menaquinone biosynthesis C-methylase UbiE